MTVRYNTFLWPEPNEYEINIFENMTNNPSISSYCIFKIDVKKSCTLTSTCLGRLSTYDVLRTFFYVAKPQILYQIEL